MAPCRVCTKDVARDAVACPHCGAPYPAKLEWDGWGYEYKSEAEILGIPLLHVSFKYRPNRMPVPARGIIAIGQFGFGIVNISQFGIGLFSLAQFTVAGYAVAQFAAAWSCICQIGVYVDTGIGQVVVPLSELLSRLS